MHPEIKEYITKHYIITFLVCMLLIWSLYIMISLLGFNITALLIIVIIFLQYKHHKDSSEHAFIKKFARTHNYTYKAQAENLLDIESSYLTMGHGQYINNIVVGNASRFYTFHSTLGDNQQARNISFTVCEKEYTGAVLNIIIDAGMHPYASEGTLGDKQKLQLEGSFNRYFTLYVPEGYHLEALQILTPDIMELLIDKSQKFSLEFSHSKLFIYAEKELCTDEELIYLNDFSTMIIEKLAPVLRTISSNYSM